MSIQESLKSKSYLRFIWVLPVSVMFLTAIMKIIRAAPILANFEKLGSTHLILPLGIVQLTSTVLFLVPKTRRIGFVLLTSYIGGIIATRAIHDTVGVGVTLNILLWIGMYFEDKSLFQLSS